MDLDLTEYDQVEEIKLFMENNGGQMYCDGASSKFLVTLSSSSYQASLDDINCESDFVFLPDYNPKQVQSITAPIQARNPNQVITDFTTTSSRLKSEGVTKFEKNAVSAPSIHHSSVIESRARININPFYPRTQPITNSCTEAIECTILQQDSNLLNPIGVTEASSSVNDAKKLSDLMQQLVTRSDSIDIEIMCTYCTKPVTCPPSDLTNWLSHMNKQHNCRMCPMCHKLIGLGSKNDVNIMRQHVVTHFDKDWLEQSTTDKSTFTFGLQQKWFSGNACEIRDSR